MDTAEIEAAVASELRAAVAGQGLNSKSIAERVGIAYATYVRYARGERSIPTGTLFVVLEALAITPSEFFARVEARMEREAN